MTVCSCSYAGILTVIIFGVEFSPLVHDSREIKKITSKIDFKYNVTHLLLQARHKRLESDRRRPTTSDTCASASWSATPGC